MSSSLSSIVVLNGYEGGNFVALGSRGELSCKRSDVSKWCVHAETGEEASDAVKAPSTQSRKPREAGSESSSSSLRDAAKGFGPRPAPSPSKPPKPSPYKDKDKDKTAITSRRPSPTQPIGIRTPDPVIREQDNAFIVGLVLLGALIFIEGLALAGAGLLPEELDALVVKYVYPAFTPTVGLFLAGSVFYGLFKVRQGGGNE